jgi:hypothetical protein
MSLHTSLTSINSMMFLPIDLKLLACIHNMLEGGRRSSNRESEDGMKKKRKKVFHCSHSVL